jgi:type I restriction enzyme, S subunit
MSAQSLKFGWKIVRFGDIAQNIAERLDPADAKTDIYVGLEHLDPNTIHLRQWGHPSNVTGQKLAFKKGDVIFGRRRAYQRKLAVAEFDGICSAHAMVVRAKPEMILPEFLPFFLQSDMFMERAIEISVGSLSPTINWKTLRVQEFPLPTLDEQKRIAEILWAADEAVEKWTGIVADLKALIDRMRDSHFSTIDNGQSAALVDMTKLITKGESPRWQGFEYIDSGVLFVTSENVLFGNYSQEPPKYIPFEFHEKLKRSKLIRGDVLVNLVGASIGRACIYTSDSEANINQAVALIRCKSSQLIPEYVLSFLLAPSNLRMLIGGSVNTARANISLTQLRDLRLPQIDIIDQKEFCQTISSISVRINQAQNQIERLSSVSKAVISGISHV